MPEADERGVQEEEHSASMPEADESDGGHESSQYDNESDPCESYYEDESEGENESEGDYSE